MSKHLILIMKKLLPLLLIGAVGSATAQVTIDELDFPEVGDTIVFGNTGLSPVPAGFSLGTVSATAQFWDFSMLETDELTETVFYDPSSVDPNNDFPDADIALDQFGGFGFIEVETNEVLVTGIAADLGVLLGLPISVETTVEAENPWQLFQFPSTLGTVLIDTAIFDFKVLSTGLIPAAVATIWNPDSVRLKRTIYTESEVDAFGTLQSVLGETHNVLRQKIVEGSLDSVWGWMSDTEEWEELNPLIAGQFGVGVLNPVYRTLFLSKEIGYYVVQVTTDENDVPESASFISDETECCTGIEEVVAAGQNVLYPNPTSDNIRVRTGGDIYQLNIMDMSGKLLQSEQLTIDGQTVELNGLANGLYVYQMLDEAGKMAHTGRFSVIK